MRNPFEEKRKNDRINLLAKQRNELAERVNNLESELDFERTNRQIIEWSLISVSNKYAELKAIVASYESAIDGLKNVVDSLYETKSKFNPSPNGE